MKIFGRRSAETTAEAQADAGPPPTSEVLNLASERIAEVVAAADRASADVKANLAEHGASAVGQSSPRDELAAELARSVIERTDELKADADNLAALLSRAAVQLAAIPVAPPEVFPPHPDPPVAAPEPAPDSAPLPFRTSPQAAAASVPPPGPPPPEDVLPPEPVETSEPVEAETLEQPADEEDLSEAAYEEDASEPEDGLNQRVTERFVSPEPVEGHAPPRFKRRSAAVDPTAEDVPAYSPEGVRLLATQMAVAGSSRDEIESRLSNEFGVEDSSALLAEILHDNPDQGSRRAIG